MSDSDEYLYDQDFEEESSMDVEKPNLQAPVPIEQDKTKINQSLNITSQNTNQNTTHSQKPSNSFVQTTSINNIEQSPNPNPKLPMFKQLVEIYMKDNPNKRKYIKEHELRFDTPKRTIDVVTKKQKEFTPIVSKTIFQQNKTDQFQLQREKLQQQEQLLKQQKFIYEQQADFHKKINQQIQNSYNHFIKHEQEAKTISQSNKNSSQLFYAKTNSIVTKKKEICQSTKPTTNSSNRTTQHHKTFNNSSTKDVHSIEKKRPVSFKTKSPPTKEKIENPGSIVLIPEVETVTAKCWSILDVKSGQLIHGKNHNMQREVASLTKIMTCWVSLHLAKKLNLNHISTYFRVSYNASNVGGTTANLCGGDRINIRDLLYGLMLPSGNDAAVTLAENFTRLLEEKQLMKKSGNMGIFIQEMNRFAREYNLASTQYANPHGLINQYNYSTALDVGQLACIAVKDPHFRKLVNTKIYFSEIEDEEKCAKEVFWENTNKLLYKGFAGVKTGITTRAGPCVVEYFKNDKQELILVLLASRSMDERWVDITKLLNWVKK